MAEEPLGETALFLVGHYTNWAGGSMRKKENLAAVTLRTGEWKSRAAWGIQDHHSAGIKSFSLTSCFGL